MRLWLSTLNYQPAVEKCANQVDDCRVGKLVSRPMEQSALTRSQQCQIGIAILLIAWRVLIYPLGVVVTDWIVVLSCFWMYATIAKGDRLQPVVVVGVMGYLLGLYAMGYLPPTLDWISHSH